VAPVDRDHRHPQHHRRRVVVVIFPISSLFLLTIFLGFWLVLFGLMLIVRGNWPAIRCACSEADGTKSCRLSGHRLDFERLRNWLREVMPSLGNSRYRWKPTVRCERNRFWPISRFDIPAAAICAI